MLIIYALQLFWFYKIVAIATGGGKDGKGGGKKGEEEAKAATAKAQ